MSTRDRTILFEAFAALLAALSLILAPGMTRAAAPTGAARTADSTVTAVVDTSASPVFPAPTPESAAAASAVATPTPMPPAGLEPWQHWAHLDDSGTPAAFRISVPGVVVGRAARFLHGEGALLTNVTDKPITLRVGARLDTGLWRVEAALAAPRLPAPESISDSAQPRDEIAPSPTPPPAAVRAWRMESVFLSQAGTSYKSVHLGPGETLIVRWTDTIAEADAACRAARHSPAAAGGPTTYTGVTVARALERAADQIGQIEALAARGRRADMVKRAQSALLIAAQAQAMARNRDDAGDSGEDGGDAIFTRLTAALSEVSCAACNLIPAETAVTDANGAVVAVRVSVTNGGSRTIPSVSLALPQPGDGTGLGAPGSERTVFRSLAPGATVTASFPVAQQAAGASPDTGSTAGPTSRAIVQFILDMGAAVVPTGTAP